MDKLFWSSVGVIVAATICCSSPQAQAYKCKNSNGAIEFSDQPCRGTTEKSVSKEYISESQYRSSTDWLRREAASHRQKERIEAAQQQQAYRQEVARQAAHQEEMRRRQDSADRQRLIQETERARMEAAEARAAAARAEAAANNAAAASNKKRNISCYEKMNGNIFCQ